MALMLTACFGQGVVGSYGGSSIIYPGGGVPIVKDAKYVLEYLSRETDPTRSYAMYCPGNPDCNTVYVDVQHLKPFMSKEEALAWLNDGFVGIFVRLLAVTDIPVTQEKKITELPQPAKVIETNAYKLTGRDRKK
jgi:hypothetical protein